MGLYKDGIKVASTNVTGDTLPIGGMIPWTSNTIPENWLLCDGQAVSRTTYASLFAVVGTTYGVGDNSTTFNVPNIKGRTIVGRDSADSDFDVLGELRGSKFLAEHSHLMMTARAVTPGGVDRVGVIRGDYSVDIYTEKAGAGQSGNLQPYIVENYIIKAQQSSGVVATVVDNLTSTSTTDALSAKQGKILNDKFNYSTSEVAIGKWLDGKILYKKTYTANITTSINYSLDITSLNADYVVLDQSISSFSHSDVYIIPIGHYGGTNDWSSWFIANKNSLSIMFGSTYSTLNKILTFTLLYTKAS